MLRPIFLSTLLLLGFVGGTSQAAEPNDKPSVEQLFAGVPMISAETDGIDQFSFSFEITAENSILFKGSYYWRHSESPRFCFSAEQHGTPVWFVADETIMLFDIVEQELILVNQAHPSVQFGVEENKVSFKYGLEFNQREAKTSIDVESFLDPMAKDQSLRQNAIGEWIYEAVSSTGKSECQVIFSEKPPFTPREISSRGTRNEKKSSTRFFNIRVNQSPETPWPGMPPQDAWPQGLDISVLDFSENAVSFQSRAFRVLATHMAIKDESLRSDALNRNLDWEQIRKIRDHFGPQLRHVIGFRDSPE